MLGLEQILELIKIQKKTYETLPTPQHTRDLVFSRHTLYASNRGTFKLHDISALLPSTPNPTASNNHLEITISWTLPTSPRPITQYIVSVNGVENQRINAPTREATFTAPNAGNYRIGVAAVNSLGTSEYGYVNVEATNPPEPPRPVAPAFTTTSFSVADAFARDVERAILIADNHFYIVGNGQTYLAVYKPDGTRVLDNSNNPLQYRPSTPTGFRNYSSGGVGQDSNIYVLAHVNQATQNQILKLNTMGGLVGYTTIAASSAIQGLTLVDNIFYFVFTPPSRQGWAGGITNNDSIFTATGTTPAILSGGLVLDAGNDHPRGITFSNDLIFVADSADRKLYAYTKTFTRSAVNDITLTYTRTPNPQGLTSHNGYIYVLDNNGMVYPIQV